MTDLIMAAKALIKRWDQHGSIITEESKQLRAAVDKADNPPSDFHEWYAGPDSRGSYQDALETWYYAQQAAIRVERERIKQIIAYQFGELVSDLSEVIDMIDDD